MFDSIKKLFSFGHCNFTSSHTIHTMLCCFISVVCFWSFPKQFPMQLLILPKLDPDHWALGFFQMCLIVVIICLMLSVYLPRYKSDHIKQLPLQLLGLPRLFLDHWRLDSTPPYTHPNAGWLPGTFQFQPWIGSLFFLVLHLRKKNNLKNL